MTGGATYLGGTLGHNRLPGTALLNAFPTVGCMYQWCPAVDGGDRRSPLRSTAVRIFYLRNKKISGLVTPARICVNGLSNVYFPL